MCSRFQFSSSEYKEFQQIVQDAQRRSCQNSEPNFLISGDVAPTDMTPVLIASGDKVISEFQRWGIPGWRGGMVINARAETVCTKPMFRRSIVERRCVIPANGYYEWDAGKHKYLFQIPGKALYFAGVYDNVDGVDCFVVLTTIPNATVQDVHDRMPFILRHEQVRPWLTDSQAALQLLTIEPPALTRNREDGQMGFEDLML